MLLYDLLYEINVLSEAVAQNRVVAAITNHTVIRIYYSGDKTIRKGYRTIEPYTVGISKKGNIILRAYQRGGETDSIVPGWKLFRLKFITRWNELNEFITEPADDFNPSGDRSMRSIIKHAKF